MSASGSHRKLDRRLEHSEIWAACFYEMCFLSCLSFFSRTDLQRVADGEEPLGGDDDCVPDAHHLRDADDGPRVDLRVALVPAEYRVVLRLVAIHRNHLQSKQC